MNLPNKLTVLRIILVLVMIIVNFFEIPGEFLGLPTLMWILDLIFIIASITDKLDGYLARSRNEVTTFGKFLDPIADKVLVVAGLAFGIADTARVEIPYLMLVVTIVIIAREFAISLFRQIAASKNVILAAGKSGKYKTTFTMMALNAFLFIPCNRFEGDGAYIASRVFWWMFIISLAIAVVLTIYSAVEYVLKNKQVFKDSKTNVEVIEEEDVEFPDEKIIDALEWCKDNNSVEILGMQQALGISYARAFRIRVWLEIMDFVRIENNQRVFSITDEDLEKVKKRKEEYYAKLGKK